MQDGPSFHLAGLSSSRSGPGNSFEFLRLLDLILNVRELESGGIGDHPLQALGVIRAGRELACVGWSYKPEVIRPAVPTKVQGGYRKAAVSTAFLAHGVEFPALRIEASVESPAATHKSVYPEAKPTGNILG
jgi:hypothetical protein